MSKIWRIATTALALALVGYFIYFAAGSLDLQTVIKTLSSPRQLAAVVVAALLYSSIIPVTGWAWRGLLASQQENWSAGQLTRILGLTQLAKYIPGNVAQHATRAALSLGAAMGTRAFLASLAQETVLAVAASVIVGLAMLALSGPGLGQLSAVMFSSLLVAGGLLATVVLALASARLHPEALRAKDGRLGRLLARLGGLPGPSATLSALLAYSLNYVLIGVGLWLVARAAGMPASVDLALVTSAFALSWVLGFLAPGAPAGLGAREGIMLLLLHGSAPDESLVIFVLLARVVTMLGDAMVFAAAACSQYWTQRKMGSTA